MDDLLAKLTALKAESFVDAKTRPASTSRRWSSAPATTRASSNACASARSDDEACARAKAKAASPRSRPRVDGRGDAGVRHSRDAASAGSAGRRQGRQRRSDRARRPRCGCDRRRARVRLGLRRAGGAPRSLRRAVRKAPANPIRTNSCAATCAPSSPTRPSITAQWAVAVHSLRHGETLYSLNAYRLQVPASNQKMLTTAVAADAWAGIIATRRRSRHRRRSSTARSMAISSSSANGDPTINPRHPERWARVRRLGAGS